MIVAERYAALSRHVIGPRDVYENGTAMAGADRIVVIADVCDLRCGGDQPAHRGGAVDQIGVVLDMNRRWRHFY